MTAEAERLTGSGQASRRKLRNKLLDARFQLKYTGMVVAVTIAVAAVLGYFAYDYSRGQTQMMTIMQMEQRNELGPKFMSYLEREADAADRKVLTGILGGIFLLALSLGLTGILVTHKVVGPAYKIKRLLGDVRDGHLRAHAGSLRRGDELRDVFTAYEEMVQALRDRQAEEVAQLEQAIEKAKQDGSSEAIVADLQSLRDRMQAELD